MNEDFIWRLGVGGLDRPTWKLMHAKYPQLPPVALVTTTSAEWALCPLHELNTTWFVVSEVAEAWNTNTLLWHGNQDDARRRAEKRLGLCVCAEEPAEWVMPTMPLGLWVNAPMKVTYGFDDKPVVMLGPRHRESYKVVS